jgi:hypothetical protein
VRAAVPTYGAAVRRFREWLLGLPLTAYFAVSTVWCTVVLYLRDAIGSNHFAASLRFDLIGGVALGLLLTGVVAARRHRYGGTNRALQVAAAVRTGRLPVEADRLTWAPLLEKKKRSFGSLQVFVAFAYAALAALCTWPAVTDTPMFWLGTVAFLSVGAVGVVSCRRHVARIEGCSGTFVSLAITGRRDRCLVGAGETLLPAAVKGRLERLRGGRPGLEAEAARAQRRASLALPAR